MDPSFWEHRWASGNIGFHSPNFNEQLLRYWPQCGIPLYAKVFVPLCGKTLDLHWLSQQGHAVMGVEVVPAAVEDFFAEAKLQPQKQKQGAFEIWSHQNLSIWLGDFFDLRPENLVDIGAWYDRAAQVALPPAMRKRYYQHLARILPSGAIGLSLAFEYPQEEKEGPPFSVEEEEIRRLCAGSFSVELLERQDRLSLEPRFKAQGLSRVDETMYRMVREG